MTALPRIRDGLLKRPLDNQVLVYDTILDRVHLLDPTTACVLELLEEGSHSADAIGAQIVARLDVAPNPDFLPLAIEELRKADLLDLSKACGEPMLDSTRRNLLKSIAMSGAAALLIPTVASLTATRGYAQGTAPNRGNCNTCTNNTNCISGLCCGGICLASCTGQPGGGCCNANGQCTSNSCIGGFCAGTTVAGGTCSNNSQCLSGNCCSGICTTVGGTCPLNGSICVANCGACTSSCQCTGVGSTCVGGVCSNSTGGSNKAALGQPCNGNGNCCSGNCNKSVTPNVCVA